MVCWRVMIFRVWIVSCLWIFRMIAVCLVWFEISVAVICRHFWAVAVIYRGFCCVGVFPVWSSFHRYFVPVAVIVVAIVSAAAAEIVYRHPLPSSASHDPCLLSHSFRFCLPSHHHYYQCYLPFFLCYFPCPPPSLFSEMLPCLEYAFSVALPLSSLSLLFALCLLILALLS